MEETRICQNCKGSFLIDASDFNFYEKIKVPPPTFCHHCRLQRRLAFRNERNLYKRKDSKTGKDIISIYSADKDIVVYEQHHWFSDLWNPMDYGKNYDFDVNFFEQIRSLMGIVPFPSLNNWNAVNTEYANFATDNKNCFFVFGGDFNENCLYSTFSFNCKDSAELYWVNKSELCCELVDSENSFNCTRSRYLKSCVNTDLSFNMTGCNDCLGSTNLRNQSHFIFNARFSKEEYNRKIFELNRGSYLNTRSLEEQFKKIYYNSIFCAYKFINAVNCTGDNIFNSKNCFYCFDIFDGAEDCRYVFLAAGGVKDTHSSDHIGLKSELCYESASIYPGSNIICSWMILNCHNIQYSINCRNSSYLFGCIGLTGKQYCIFNKQYSKEEYERLVPKIIKHMNTSVFKDKNGVEYKYGEFFPIELSPFCYNETVAQEAFPFSQAESLKGNLKWKNREKRDYNSTIEFKDLPDDIKDVNDSILKEIISCAHFDLGCNEDCITAFRITREEFQLYKRLSIPLPRLCPNCRHYQKVKKRNKPILWHRRCMCEKTSHSLHEGSPCGNEFETSYAPDRPEIVYCEKCYQQEVY